MIISNQVRELLQREIKEKDELEYCKRAEEILDDVLEGIVMRKSELENERKGE